MRSDGRDAWATPWSVIRAVERRLGGTFVLDVAASAENRKAPRHYDPYSQPGSGRAWARSVGLGDATTRRPLVWCNPPYSELAGGVPWLRWCAECGESVTTIALVPCSLAAWWRATLPTCSRILAPVGRIAFVAPEGIESSSPSFDTWLLVWEPGRSGPPTVEALHHRDADQLTIGGYNG